LRIAEPDERRRLNLNADLGESFGWYRYGVDADLMGLITSANIACGFHAGDSTTMRTTVDLPAEHGVRIGAHMGLPDRMGFGRREMQISAEDAYDYSLHQIGALDGFVRRRGIALSHIKPHGALYMMAARDGAIAYGIARAARDFSPTLSVLCAAELDTGLREPPLRNAGCRRVLRRSPVCRRAAGPMS
jgi:UPF0271 protein